MNRKEKLKKICNENDFNKAVDILIDEDLAVSKSEAKRIVYSLKDGKVIIHE